MRLARGIVGAAALAVVFVVSAYVSFNLYVRRGATSVPELAGLSVDEAGRLLADQGLKYRPAEPAGRWSADVEEGRVLESRPRAGSSVKQGSTVEVVVSLGSRLARVPDLAGKAVSAAELTARAEGLELGRTLSVLFGAGEPGAVVGQFPAAGESAPAGAKIDLLVALESPGSAYVMPDLVYRPWSLEGDRIESRDVSGALPVVQVGLVWRRGSSLPAAAKEYLRVAETARAVRDR